MLPFASLALLGSSVLCGAVGTWMARAVARRTGVVDRPNPIVPQHVRPVAHLGGMGVAAGIALVAAGLKAVVNLGWVEADEPPATSGLIAPAVLFLLLGLYDDLRPLSTGRKFVLQACIAALATSLGVVCPLSGYMLIDCPLSLVWILILVNATNLTDVCDGLVAGLAAISLIIAAQMNSPVTNLALLSAGVCVGFLVFNRPPASVFLGDSGSHLLGYLIAAFTLYGAAPAHLWPFLGKIVLATAVLLFELVFLIVVRTQRGIPPWRGSPDHFSLRLQAGGLSRWTTDLVAWSVAALCGVAALGLDRFSAGGQAAILVCVAVFFALAWRSLLPLEVRTA